MKQLIVGFIALTGCTLCSAAQGVLSFSNRDIARGVDAPVHTTLGPGGELADSRYVAQLWAGADAGSLAPISVPAPFRDGAGAGYWNAPLADRVEGLPVPGVTPGADATVQVFVWEARFPSLQAAAADGGFWFSSETFVTPTGTPGSPGPPPVPANPAPLIGLAFPIPEPTSISLSLLGLGLVLFLRGSGNRKAT